MLNVIFLINVTYCCFVVFIFPDTPTHNAAKRVGFRSPITRNKHIKCNRVFVRRRFASGSFCRRCLSNLGDDLSERTVTQRRASGSDIIGYGVTDMAMPLLRTV